MPWMPLTAVLIAGIVPAFVWTKYRALKREDFIRHAMLPAGLFEKLRRTHPALSHKDCQLVGLGLRQFFLAHLKSGRQYVSMPSQVVDDLWHEFILHTKSYDTFCSRAFGRFLHHTPTVALRNGRKSNTGLRRCWWFACKEENINPRGASRLPLLFALDAKLQIAGGFYYVADCMSVRRHAGQGEGAGAVHCGGDFADLSFDGNTDGFADSASHDGHSDASHGGTDGGSNGSGDGGSDGCGGGGCGGGD
jgi:hypothetical protein